MEEKNNKKGMKWICDNCGKEFRLKFDPDNDSIDPPYFCDDCEKLMEEAEPEDTFDDDFMNYGGFGDG